MDLGEKIRQLDEQVAAAVRRALDDVRNELRSGLDQAIDDLRGKLAEVSPELPESFFTEEALRRLTEEAAPAGEDVLTQARAEARVEGQTAGREALGSDLCEALVAVDRARSQNDVLQALVDRSSRFASRAALLLLRPEGLVGWVAHGFEGASEDVRTASVAAQAEDWSTAVGGEGPRRLGPSRCAQLVNQLDSPVPVEGVAIPVLLRDRVSAVFYADRATAGDPFDVAALQALVYTTALALETLAFRQREATATLEAVTGEVAPAPEPEAEAEVAPFELPAEEESPELAEEAPAAVEEAPAVFEEAPAAVEEEPPAIEEAPAAVEESLEAFGEALPEPEAETAAEELEAEELELEDFEAPELEEPGFEAAEAEAGPEEEEVEVIELPEDVGEMELETEEDQTASWRSWKPPTAAAEPDSILEVVDLEAESAVEEAVPLAEPTAETEVEGADAEVELLELEPEAPSAEPEALSAETVIEEAAPTGAETRTIAGFEHGFEAMPSAEPPAPPAAEEGVDEGAVEIEIEDLELDAEALEDLPELEAAPPAAAGAPELEIEIEEELPEAGAGPMTEAVELEEAEPVAAMEPEAPAPAEAAPPDEPEASASPASGTFAGTPSDLPSGGPIEPPTDVQGPGLAFSDKGPAVGDTGDDAAHQEARRLARLLVSEIQLYNQEEVEEGRRNGDIYERLKDDIDRSRQLYEERVAPNLRESTDYFYQELVRQLGAGDAKALGI